MLTQAFGTYIGLGLHAVVIGHVVVAIPYTILTVLPLLEFTLAALWSGLAAGKAAAETLKALGGVGGALARAAAADPRDQRRRKPRRGRPRHPRPGPLGAARGRLKGALA